MKIRVVGIQIGESEETIKLYVREERITHPGFAQNIGDDHLTPAQRAQEMSCLRILSATGLNKIEKILEHQSLQSRPYETQYIVAYDTLSSRKEELVSRVHQLITNKGTAPCFTRYIAIGSGEPLNPTGERIESISDFPSFINQELANYQKQTKHQLEIQKQRSLFENALNSLSLKADALKQRGHLYASNKARLLASNLKGHGDQYFLNPTANNLQTFKERAKKELLQGEAYDVLSKHRGWGRLIGNIVLCILGFGILYGLAVCANGGLFFNRTDSAEKLHEADETIEHFSLAVS